MTPTTPTTPAPTTMTKVSTLFERILGGIEMATAIASSIPSPVSGMAHLADYFLKIIQAAVHAHETITGQPLDMSKLHHIDPVE